MLVTKTVTVSWEDVVKRHGSRAAVQFADGQVRSILCGGTGHSDDVSDEKIEYVIPNRPYYRRSLQAFESSASKGAKFEVFYKLHQNVWRDMGYFMVASIELRGLIYCINLERVKSKSTQEA
jgi:prepilin-type processing-associated H-X9-DG protein